MAVEFLLAFGDQLDWDINSFQWGDGTDTVIPGPGSGTAEGVQLAWNDDLLFWGIDELLWGDAEEIVSLLTSGGNWVARRRRSSQSVPRPSVDARTRQPAVKPGEWGDTKDYKFWRDVNDKRLAAKAKDKADKAAEEAALKQADAEKAKRAAAAEAARRKAAKEKAKAELMRQVRAMMRAAADQETQMLLDTLWMLRDKGGLSPRINALIGQLIETVAP